MSHNSLAVIIDMVRLSRDEELHEYVVKHKLRTGDKRRSSLIASGRRIDLNSRSGRRRVIYLKFG